MLTLSLKRLAIAALLLLALAAAMLGARMSAAASTHKTACGAVGFPPCDAPIHYVQGAHAPLAAHVTVHIS